MSAYSIALFLHLLFLLAAVAATALAGFVALQLRNADGAGEARTWGAFLPRIAWVFPVASAGLLFTGAYMVWGTWKWSTPWVVAGIVGLAMIILLGAGIQGARGRMAEAELRAAGLSARARRLLRDPIAWSAKVTTWSLTVAVTFVMTAKPAAAGCTVALAAAVIGGVLLAAPFWRAPAAASSVAGRAPQSPDSA